MKERWWELPVLVVAAVAMAVLVKSFLVQPFYIPSGSMEHTLYGCPGCAGDKILVNKAVFDVRSPHKGDIIVFARPEAWPVDVDVATPPRTNAVTGVLRRVGQLAGVIQPDGEDLVKRVIAVGGQTVKCCDAQGRVQVSDAGPGGPFRSLTENYTDLTDPDGSEIKFRTRHSPARAALGDGRSPHRLRGQSLPLRRGNRRPAAAEDCVRPAVEHGADQPGRGQSIRHRMAATPVADPALTFRRRRRQSVKGGCVSVTNVHRDAIGMRTLVGVLSSCRMRNRGCGRDVYMLLFALRRP